VVKNMGYRIESFNSENLENLTIPGTAIPTLFWAIPVGNWEYQDIYRYWESFVNQGRETNYYYGLFIAKGDYSLDSDGNRISTETAKLHSLIDTDSDTSIEIEAPSLLILSSAYPQPGYGLLISSDKNSKKFLEISQFERLIKNIINELRIERTDFRYLFNEYKHLYYSLSNERGQNRVILSESGSIKKGKKSEMIGNLEAINSLISKKDYKEIYTYLLNSFTPQMISDYGNNLFNDGKIFNELIMSIVILNNHIQIEELKKVYEKYLEEIKNNTSINKKKYWDNLENKEISIYLKYFTKVKFGLDTNEINKEKAQSVLNEFIKKSQEIIKSKDIFEEEEDINFKEFFEIYNKVFKIQLELAPKFLMLLEKEIRSRYSDKLEISSFSWDKPRMIGWKLFTADVAPTIHEFNNILKNYNLTYKNNSQNEDSPKYINGSVFTDYIHMITEKSPLISKRQSTLKLIELLRERDVDRLYENLGINHINSLDFDQLLNDLGWPNETNPKVDSLRFLIDSYESFVKGDYFRSVRVSMENYIKDIIWIEISRFNRSFIENFYRSKVTDKFKRDNDLETYISGITLGNAAEFLKVFWDNFPSLNDNKIKEYLVTLMNLNEILKSSVHNKENVKKGKNYEELKSEDLRDKLETHLTLAEEIFKELPWHLSPMQSSVNFPFIISGNAWSHSYGESKIIRIMYNKKSSVKSKELLVWNPSKINPVMSEAKILKKK
jgi:hypothetical protein